LIAAVGPYADLKRSVQAAVQEVEGVLLPACRFAHARRVRRAAPADHERRSRGDSYKSIAAAGWRHPLLGGRNVRRAPKRIS